jgi:hypothetical protein
MSEKGPEADIEPRRFNVADVPIPEVRNGVLDVGFTPDCVAEHRFDLLSEQ